MQKETRIITIEASHKTRLSGWKTRWDNTSTSMNISHQLVINGAFDFPDKVTFQQIIQLQTGYTVLNAHRHRLVRKYPQNVHVETLRLQSIPSINVLSNSSLWLLYSSQWSKWLYSSLGIISMDMKTLSENGDHSHIQSWWDTVQKKIGHYLKATGRLSGSSSDTVTNRAMSWENLF